MRVKYSKEEELFRNEVVQWLKKNMPPEIKDQTLGGTTLDPELLIKWHKLIFEKGWIALEIPEEAGGGGKSLTEQFIFNYEYSNSGAPRLKTKLMSIGMLAPLLIKFGTREQQERFIPGIMSGDLMWCQGFSEPDAGSDLASLVTEAVLDGNSYIINGQKMWTSMADSANWIFMLVRTDSKVKKQAGISFILVDLKTPGITIRPIEELTDHSAFCEVFFDNVRVPVENLVGQPNEGWMMAGFLLQHERLNAFPIGELIYAIETVRKNAREMKYKGKAYIKDAGFRKKLSKLDVDCRSLLYTFFRILSKMSSGSEPGPESSLLKVYGAELYQRVLDLNMEVMGPYGQSWYNLESLSNDVHQATKGWINSRGLTIWGGSSEIQRTIIARRVLKLPGN